LFRLLPKVRSIQSTKKNKYKHLQTLAPCLYEEIYSGEGLGITLSSILQTFNLKMEKYEGKYKEILKEPRAYVEGEGKRARNLS